MRNGVLGLLSALLLGGVVALGLPSTQEQPAGSTPQGQQAEGGTPRLATGGITITPDVVDCVSFSSVSACGGSIVVRPTQAALGRTFELRAVVTDLDGQPVSVRMDARCNGCKGAAVRIPREPALVVPFTLTLPEGWRDGWAPRVGSGFLGLVSPDTGLFEGAPKRLRVLAPSPSGWQTLVVLTSLIVTLLIGVAVAFRLCPRVSLGDRMGAPSWKASESWSSNLTVGAALVNGVLALAVIGDFTVFMTKPSYGVVSMLFGSLVLLAPLVYGIWRARVTVTDAKNPLAADEFEGYVAVFLVAGVLTLWSSAGQLMTFALLVGEVWRAGALGALSAGAIVALTLGVLCALLAYGYFSMLQAAAGSKKPGRKDAARREQRTGAERAPAWSLL